MLQLIYNVTLNLTLIPAFGGFWDHPLSNQAATFHWRGHQRARGWRPLGWMAYPKIEMLGKTWRYLCKSLFVSFKGPFWLNRYIKARCCRALTQRISQLLRYQSTKKCRRSRCRNPLHAEMHAAAQADWELEPLVPRWPAWWRSYQQWHRSRHLLVIKSWRLSIKTRYLWQFRICESITMTPWPSRHWHWRWDAYSKSFQGRTEQTWESWNHEKPEPGADTTGDTCTSSFWAGWLWKA